MAKKFPQLRANMPADAQAQANAKAQKMLKSIPEEWPDSVKAMAGSWPDFPETEALREDLGVDVEREPLCDANQDNDSAFGLWPKQNSDDGLKYQKQLRSEWDKRPSHSELRAAQVRSKVDSAKLIREDRDSRS